MLQGLDKLCSGECRRGDRGVPQDKGLATKTQLDSPNLVVLGGGVEEGGRRGAGVVVDLGMGGVGVEVSVVHLALTRLVVLVDLEVHLEIWRSRMCRLCLARGGQLEWVGL